MPQVIEHAEKQHDIEGADAFRGEIHHVDIDVLHSRPEHLARQRKPRLRRPTRCRATSNNRRRRRALRRAARIRRKRIRPMRRCRAPRARPGMPGSWTLASRCGESSTPLSSPRCPGRWCDTSGSHPRAPAAPRSTFGSILSCGAARTPPCTKMKRSMAEWKDTLNLPRTDFPMKANLQTAEPQALARWKEMRLYERIREHRAGRPEVRAARRAAVRERPDPPRHRDEQDPQGSRGQVADDDGLRRAVRARLRLPRPADRIEGRSRARPEEARHVDCRVPARLPRLRRRASST